MKLIAMSIAAALAAGAFTGASGAPYEDQKLIVQRVQEAKLRGSAAVNEHEHKGEAANAQPGMSMMMQDMNRQMQQARSADQMNAEQMRSWIGEHMRTMDQMHRQMTQESR